MRRCFGSYCFNMSSLRKIWFPAERITKGDIADYYDAVADLMIPHMKNRLLTMQRFPEGLLGEGFFQHNAPGHFPAWIEFVEITKKNGGVVRHVVCNNKATLVYLVQYGCLTPHLSLSKVDNLLAPDQLIFDVDPPRAEEFAKVVSVAMVLKDILEQYGCVPLVKLTGSRGLHVVVPLNRQASFATAKACAHAVAKLVVDQIPTLATLEVRKAKRGKKIFLDTLRNDPGATAVAPYAVRPGIHAPVAAPILWEELLNTDLRSDFYTIRSIMKRLAKRGDVWRGMMRHAISLENVYKSILKHPLLREGLH